MPVPGVRLATLLLLLCLAGCTSRTPGEPLPDRAAAEGPSPSPTEPAATSTATPTPAFTPTPTPSLTVSGDYDYPAVHADGRYELQLAGTRVAATFATSRSPVEHWVRQTVPQPLFTIPAPFRPPYSIRRMVEGTPVHADGPPDPARTAPHRFLLRVDPDGGVHYLDNSLVDGAGHLAYVLHTVWDTAPPPSLAPTSTPTPTSTATATPTFTPTFTPTPPSLPTPTPTFVHAVPSPTPSLTWAGVYDNLAEHADGRYALQRAGARVAATFSTSRSPVQYWAREVPPPLFTVPEGFRPPYSILRTVVGTPVLADGSPDPDQWEPRRFLLRVEPDGDVHYVDDSHVEGVGYLAYLLDTVWGTTPAANDRAVLEILDRHWFRRTLLSAEPPPVQWEVPEQTIVDAWGDEKLVPAHRAGAFVTLDGAGRVTELGAPGHALSGILLPELGQLHWLEQLDLGYFHPLSYKGRDGRYAAHAKRRIECDYGWVRCIGIRSFPKRADMTTKDNLQALEWADMTTKDSLQALEWLSTWLSREDVPDHLVWPEVGHLTGAIPPQLGQLNSLRHLDLAGHLLTGPLPPAIGSLVNLEYLDLRDNWLTGSLPPAIGHPINLKHLDLSYNWLTGPLPPAIGHLVHLEHLDLRENWLTGPLPPAWGRLTNLRDLHLNNIGLSGLLPPEWGQLTHLQTLFLDLNRLTGPLPAEWGQLANLQTLDLYANGLTGSLPPAWGQLTSLHTLDLSRNQLTGPLPPEWGQLDSLQKLDLEYNQLTGPLPPEWGQLGSLQMLNLSRHTYPPPGPPGNQLTGPLPPEWGQLDSLLWLYLHGNRLTGPLPPEWGQLDSLQKLDLEYNQLTGPLPPEWSQLDSLQHLSLSRNRLTGPVPPEWSQLTSLQVLGLDGNRLTGCYKVSPAIAVNIDLPRCPD